MTRKIEDSVILLDKPVGFTSSDAVAKLKKIISQKKIGHSGTIDRFASGLLVVCTGRFTCFTRFFLEHDKSYIAKVQLGITTDTYDTEGEVTGRYDISNLTEKMIIDAAEKFKGGIFQLPPQYSALKIKGERASDIARRGGEVALEKRKIFIKDLDLSKIDTGAGTFEMSVSCSKGTYIRSLARDIGDMLGVGAHLTSLRRISSGKFRIENSAGFDEIADYVSGVSDGSRFLLGYREALSDFGVMTVNDFAVKRVMNGAPFPREDIVEFDKKRENLFIIVDNLQNLIAIADIDIEKWYIRYFNVFN